MIDWPALLGAVTGAVSAVIVKRMTTDRIRTKPYCDILRELAVLLVDLADDETGLRDLERIVQRRWPQLTRELRRREQRRIWVDCDCALCAWVRENYTD